MSAKQERPAFLPLSSEVDDDQLEQLARQKGVGTLERPKAASAVPAVPVEIERTEGRATPRAKMKTLNLELPDYAWTEIKIRAAQRQTSLRHVVMMALVADGITIREPDIIEDGRRLR